MRRALPALTLALGLAVGAVVTSAVRSDGEGAVLPPAAPAAVTVSTAPASPTGVLLVWVPGGLPAGFAGRIAAGDELRATTVVAGDTVQLASSTDSEGAIVDHPSGGRTIPLDAIAVDCASWSSVVPLAEASAVCGLGPGDALLGATSAGLRRLGPGATITLANGYRARVAGVVDDAIVGAAELVVRREDATAAGVDTERYILATYAGDRAAAEAHVRAATDVELRVRGPGETPWLRHGDAVLPQSLLKEVFGEFSARTAGGGTLELDASWTDAHLVRVDLPVLGRARCHRALVPALAGALGELEARGLLTTLDRRASGCWNARLIAGTDQPSRHAWGAAVDLVPLPPGDEVIDVMARWGFTWGGHWLHADPVHFEYVRPAPASS